MGKKYDQLDIDERYELYRLHREENRMNVKPVEHRRHLRYSVKEPCTADLDDGEHNGAVVNMSVSGACVHLDVELDAKLEPDTIVDLQVQRIGGVHTRVVRPLIDGMAVEFLFDPVQDRELIARLWKVLNEYSPCSGRPC